MKDALAGRVVEVLENCLAGRKRPVVLHEPRFTGNEWQYVKECIDTGWVSSAGRFVDQFEVKLAELTGVKQAVAVVNGTAALHICLMLAGVLPGDEVLVPTLTFVATANAVSYCSALPHFVDSDQDTLGVTPAKLNDYLEEISSSDGSECINRYTGQPIRALVVTHTFGHPADLDALADVCSRHSIALIEDAAEALGSLYKERHVGNWGVLSAISFNGNKIVTAGGGGAVLTNNVQLGNLAKHLTTTAKTAHRWAFSHDAIGYNYRLPNLNAALVLAQLEYLEELVERKRELADRYRQAFAGMDGLRFFKEPEFARSNYWLNALVLDESRMDELNHVLEATNAAGFHTRPSWKLMHRLPMFTACPHMDLSVSESLSERIVNLPSSAFL